MKRSVKSYYFVENNALKGIHKVPGLNDESNEYFYQFNETTGACEGKVTGLIEFDDVIPCAIEFNQPSPVGGT